MECALYQPEPSRCVSYAPRINEGEGEMTKNVFMDLRAKERLKRDFEATQSLQLALEHTEAHHNRKKVIEMQIKMFLLNLSLMSG